MVDLEATVGGNHTHHNKNKCESTVDLAIIYYYNNSLIETNPTQPEYSDHSKIILTIKNVKPLAELPSTDYNWGRIEPGFKWNEIEPDSLTALNSEEVLNEINSCEDFLAAGLIDSTGKAIQNILMTVGNDITKHKSRQIFHSNPKRQGIKKRKIS